jgi:hypothetical protein
VLPSGFESGDRAGRGRIVRECLSRLAMSRKLTYKM